MNEIMYRKILDFPLIPKEVSPAPDKRTTRTIPIAANKCLRMLLLYSKKPTFNVLTIFIVMILSQIEK